MAEPGEAAGGGAPGLPFARWACQVLLVLLAFSLLGLLVLLLPLLLVPKQAVLLPAAPPPPAAPPRASSSVLS